MRRALLLLCLAVLGAAAEERLYDPCRRICELDQTEFTVQWSTAEPCATKLQLREGGEPCMTWQPEGRKYEPWKEGGRLVENATTGIAHRLTVRGLKPGTRYYYRLYNEQAEPTATEVRWGAQRPWSREYSVSTLAPSGWRTVLRVPVKVLIVPNLYNMYNARNDQGEWAPLPPSVTPEQKERIRQEFEIAARFWFVNNGFRVWHDLQYFWDETPQYWGEMPEDAPAEYKALKPCRNFPGREFSGTGGGEFTILLTNDVGRANFQPVHDGYAGQIENDLERRFDWNDRQWHWCTSGGGTLGADNWADGIPGRSQFLGDDVAWLTAHEYHHQIEAQAYLSGLDAENDRVVFDHFSNRFRHQKENGEWEEFTWDCGGKFGEHWSGIACTDRSLTDIQWLRLYFGTTVMARDWDGDGVPDNGPFPFTEAKYGYDDFKRSTDGVLDDFAKIRQSIWSGGAMSPWFSRDISNLDLPVPGSPDSDGDGIDDIADPLPTIPYQPLIWPLTAQVDGDPGEWGDIPYIGRKTVEGTTWSFKQGHDDSFYYGLVSFQGPISEIYLMLDGEADGIYNGYKRFGNSRDLYEIHIFPDGPDRLRVSYQSEGKGLVSAFTKVGDTFYVEFSIENRGESTWFWKDGGREIGSVVTVRLPNMARYTLGDGYQPVYCFMEPISGQKRCPVPIPGELSEEEASVSLDFAASPDLGAYEFTGDFWEVRDGALCLKGGLDPDESCYLLVPGFTGQKDFAVWMEFEATQDGVLGAFANATRRIDPGQDSIGFVGGYLNELAKIRLINMGEVTESRVSLTPGVHTMLFQRQGDYFFLNYDGRNVGWYRETSERNANRLGVFGVPGSDLKVRKLRVRGEK